MYMVYNLNNLIYVGESEKEALHHYHNEVTKSMWKYIASKGAHVRVRLKKDGVTIREVIKQ